MTHETRTPRLRRLKLASAFPSVQAFQQPADPLAISEIRAWPIKEPVSGRRYSVIRLQTGSGVFGFGECSDVQAGDLATAVVLLRGQPATATEVLGRLLRGHPELRSAVNMAALDIAARSAKVPLHQYLGGPTRFKVRVMARLEGSTEGSLLDSMIRGRAAGYRAFAVPVPAEKPRELLDRLRMAAGDGIDFVAEAPAALSPALAAGICRSLESFHPYWFDEPCAASNIPVARRLSSESVTPLGFGRTIVDSAHFEALLREEVIDILRPDLGLHGVSGIRKIATMGETRYVAVAPWHEGGPVATAAALHLAASLPNFFIQQVPFPAAEADRGLRAAIGGSKLEAATDGYMSLPDGYGTGISPNLKVLEQFQEVGR